MVTFEYGENCLIQFEMKRNTICTALDIATKLAISAFVVKLDRYSFVIFFYYDVSRLLKPIQCTAARK